MLIFKDGGGNRSRRRNRERVLPVPFDARGLGKTLARVFVRQYASSGFVNPFVAAGVVEMPVGVYQLLDRICVDARESFRNVRTGGDDFRINQQLSVRAGKDSDISTSAQKDTDIAAKVLNRHFCGYGFLERTSNQAVGLGDKATWNKTRCGGRTPNSEKQTA